jgi:hypothetical protein
LMAAVYSSNTEKNHLLVPNTLSEMDTLLKGSSIVRPFLLTL